MPVSFYDRILVLRRIPNREYSGFEGEREKEKREKDVGSFPKQLPSCFLRLLAGVTSLSVIPPSRWKSVEEVGQHQQPERGIRRVHEHGFQFSSESAAAARCLLTTTCGRTR